MKNFSHLYGKLFRSPLMLRNVEREIFEQHLLSRIYGATAPAFAVEPAIPQAAATDKMPWRVARVFEQFGDVAVIHIDGVIDKRISSLDMSCYGGCDLADIDAALSICASDPGIQRIVLDIHSPGGSVVGVHETWLRIKQMQETDKEIHAYVNAMACSAGYYIASSADLIAAAPSAIVGSIGVYLAVLDASKWMELEGLHLQMIKAGKWKDTGSQHRPLTEEETSKLQGEVDAMHAQFKSAVTQNRQIAPESMEGQWMTATQGHEQGLVDELTVATLDEYVAGLLSVNPSVF